MSTRAPFAGSFALLLVLPALAVGAPGDLDRSFSGNGYALGTARVSTQFPTSRFPVALQSGDSIIATDGPARVVRYTPSGKLDRSFGRDGAGEIPLGNVADLAVDQQDRVVIALSRMVPLDADRKFIVRLLPDGAIDTSFAQAGIFDTGINESTIADIGNKIAVDPAGGLAFVAGGDTLLRLTPQGQLDSSFAGDGRLELDASLNSFQRVFYDVAIRPDGSILGLHNALSQYLSDGTPDLSFGAGGTASICCTELTLAPDGSSYVQGGSCPQPSEISHCFGGLTRATPSGVRDSNFSKDANVNQTPAPQGLVADPQGRILIGNAAEDSVFPRLAGAVRVTRTSSEGIADPSFGRSGTATAFPRTCRGAVADLAVDSQGRIVAGIGACERPGVARFTVAEGPPDADADGALDDADRCRLLAGSGHRGCPSSKQRLRLTKIGRREASGTIEARLRYCQEEVRVKVMRVRRGPSADVKVGAARSQFDNRKMIWTLHKRLDPGIYYAKVDRGFAGHSAFYEGGSGFCDGARSRSRRLG